VGRDQGNLEREPDDDKSPAGNNEGTENSREAERVHRPGNGQDSCSGVEKRDSEGKESGGSGAHEKILESCLDRPQPLTVNGGQNVKSETQRLQSEKERQEIHRCRQDRHAEGGEQDRSGVFLSTDTPSLIMGVGQKEHHCRSEAEQRGEETGKGSGSESQLRGNQQGRLPENPAG